MEKEPNIGRDMFGLELVVLLAALVLIMGFILTDMQQQATPTVQATEASSTLPN